MLENTEGPKKNMDNSEKLVTWSTQDEEKQNKNTTKYVLASTMLTHILAFSSESSVYMFNQKHTNITLHTVCVKYTFLVLNFGWGMT